MWTLVSRPFLPLAEVVNCTAEEVGHILGKDDDLASTILKEIQV
jgi:hypothetical protein